MELVTPADVVRLQDPGTVGPMRDDSPMEGDLGDLLGVELATVDEATFEWEGEDWYIELTLPVDPLIERQTVMSWMEALRRFHPYVRSCEEGLELSMCIFALEPEHAVELAIGAFAKVSALSPVVRLLEARRGALGHTVMVS